MMRFLFWIELGILPLGALLQYDPTPDMDLVQQSDPIFIDLDLYSELYTGIEWNHFGIAGSVRTYLRKTPFGYTFQPNSVLYGAQAWFRTDWMELGYRHYCQHPVIVRFEFIRTPHIEWESAYAELYLRIGGEFGG